MKNKVMAFARQRGIKEDGTKSKNEIICYECKKLGHIGKNCPLRKKKKDKRFKNKVLK